MNSIKVSIIVPVYNVEQYLVKCLDSLINQTLKEIEIICINDGSTDNSLEILNAYSQKDSRVKVIDKENEGVSAARNIGLEQAQGEYVMFVDSDDYLELKACELAYNQIINSKADLLLFNYYHETVNGKKESNQLNNLLNYEKFYFDASPEAFYNIMTGVCGKLFRNKGLCKFNTSLRKGEDTVFFWEYCLSNNPSISVLNQYLYNYVEHFSSAMFNDSYIKKGFIFDSICYLVKTNLFRTASQEVQLNILNRWARSVCYEMNYFIHKKGVLFSLSYYVRVKKFIKMFSKYNKLLLANLQYYKKLKKILTSNKGYFNIPQLKVNVSNLAEYKIVNLFGFHVKLPRYRFRKPVDLVYCWVDGNDVEWQKEKQYWQEKLGIPITDAINPCRFVDNEELKYSLRSVVKNLPWINHIYIITNGQVPKWLDVSHPKITIVTHKDIMPPEALPVFSAYPIETCLANIPNLSNYFLYANDDFFVYKHTSPDYFFDTEGKPIIRFCRRSTNLQRIQKELYIQNIIYSEKLIRQKFGKACDYETTHNIDAYRKDYFLECQNIFENEFLNTTYSKFSSQNMVQRTIVNFYMLVKKSCKLRVLRLNSKKNPLENIYVPLQNPIFMDRKIQKHKKKLKLFCINDNEKTKQEDRLLLKSYLEILFPNRQLWEVDQ